MGVPKYVRTRPHSITISTSTQMVLTIRQKIAEWILFQYS